MHAVQNDTPRTTFNLSPERKAFLIAHAGLPGWSIEQLARHFGVPMTVVHSWLERDDVNRAIIARKFEGARQTIQGDSPKEFAPAQPETPPEPEPEMEVVSDEIHHHVAHAILGPDYDRAVVMTTIEPAAPRPADAPKLPLTVLIEDLDDSLLVALMRKLPASGEWSVLERDLWLDAFHACLALSVRLNGGA